jgi:hypothetical protein
LAVTPATEPITIRLRTSASSIVPVSPTTSVPSALALPRKCPSIRTDPVNEIFPSKEVPLSRNV